ncbi:restriction endonuclease [Halobaculum lipolyticum]|uniref:Restriction endonuclease n=1 Tax=Halobaculum lipolyticum TaxID=3032001 RepID=A0ABD5W660_9EURY|nr:restriction endonuclease [Halobaculum sp. DT31]
MTDGDPRDAGGGRVDGAGSVRALSSDRLRDLVARTWRASGWRVEPTDGCGSEGVFVATRDGDDGGVERRLLQILDAERRPSAPAVRRAVEVMRRHDAEGAVVVSTVEFGARAVAVADVYGVDLVGPAALARAVDDPSAAGGAEGTDRPE